MRFNCRGADCQKDFSTISNRNKHEKVSQHYYTEEKLSIYVPYDDETKLYSCPTESCSTTSTYRNNILKHLKSCYQIHQNRKKNASNKICNICGKEFTKKCNRDRHVRDVHAPSSNDDSDTDRNDVNLENEREELPSMIFEDSQSLVNVETMQSYEENESSILSPLHEPQPHDVTNLTHSSINDETMQPVHVNEEESNSESLMTVTPPRAHEVPESSTTETYLRSPVRSQVSFPVFSSKVRRLETVIKNLNTQLDYTHKLSVCAISHLKNLLENNRREGIIYMDECFGSMLEDESFLKWLAHKLDYRPYLLKKMLNKKSDGRTETRKIDHQSVYDFWLKNSIISNDSVNSSKRMTKEEFTKKYKNIEDKELIEEEKVHKKTENILMVVATKRIYVEPVRKLLKMYNATHDDSVSLSAFYNLKPFYCFKPTEKEKQSCLCIYCLNPHVMLKSINCFRVKNNLEAHKSLTTYLNDMSSGKQFYEMSQHKVCKYYEYRRVIESYIGKNGKRIEYTRTARVDLEEPVAKIVEKLRECGNSYLKHRTYVDNVSSVFPLLKESYTGKYIELDFSQNLAPRPKDEVQSAHFSGKQFTLHCSIVEPAPYRYHYHLSDDTKHDPMFVDTVIRDLIEKYNIEKEDVWIQSDNAPSQYKNKYAFEFYQELADEFDLRIIRTYGASGHGKGVIDAMSSFGVKNIVRHDIVTKDVFFSNSETIVNYLSAKKPEYSYTHLPADEIALKRFNNERQGQVISQCMKQHLFVYQKGKDVLLQEYLCDCGDCLELNFDSCSKTVKADVAEIDEEINFFEEEEPTENGGVKVFDFVDVPSYATVFTGTTAEPLFFLKLNEKGICDSTMSDTWGHVIMAGEKYFKGNYLKVVRSRKMNFKKFDVLPLEVLVSPDEIYDTYVEINEQMHLDHDLYNSLIRKALS